ncbi:bifunctional diguanylate cyclase/phosphodiesterase [Idiomarina sp. HP20-50]|uniref:sensor domain-containing protein n=1 Tax=Idiomarina sp. HP20-50 TaxID=3070813 RepID=UPI00294B074A|nr:bifunctional diguanylate cyclase/phosphodiesterase [Idiomarina sp. HP20-50]MDV6317025.1 bifunctional diguanylate cyclase/phosphodiesterase [Idiomarina sp. HP20-50]
MNFLNEFFLLSDEGTSKSDVPNWRVSALRIILSSGMLLCLAVFLNSFFDAVESNLFHIIGITSVFLGSMLGLLWLSRHYYRFCAHFLQFTIIMASVACNLFLADPNLAQIGSMLMYACPLTALMLMGGRSALFYGVLNIIPFYIISNNVDLSFFAQPEVQFPNVVWYISGTMFVFFNVCIPLAVGRTIVAAKRLNQEMKKSNDHLEGRNALYRVFFSESRRPKVIVSEEGIITDFNKLAAKTFGLSESVKNEQQSISSWFPEMSHAGAQVIRHESTYHRVARLAVPEADSCIYEFVDCTQEKALETNLTLLEQENRRLRYLDTQTDLPNNDWFELQCNKLISKYDREFFVVVAQNDSEDYLRLKYGESIVRKLLVSAYNRLKKHERQPRLTATIALNKLVFILPQTIENELEDVLSDIKASLDKEYTLQNVKCQPSFQFGVAKFPNHGTSADVVVSRALEAKKFVVVNQFFHIYNTENSEEFMERHEISILLDEAIQNDELDICFQPKVNADGACVGLEALARWNSPVLGVIPPGTFIPIAEEYRMISRLTDLVVQKVCSQMAHWKQDNFPLLPVAINISLLDFSQPDFISKLVKHLADFSVKPAQIELELTETCLEANRVNSLELMNELQSWGFKVSVDDFGVGYSSITRLANYPIDKLKLDRALIREIKNSARQYSLVKGIYNICCELNIQCVVEGVEEEAQLQRLKEIGFSEFQGFYFSKPLTVGHYEKHVSRYGQLFSGAINKRTT